MVGEWRFGKIPFVGGFSSTSPPGQQYLWLPVWPTMAVWVGGGPLDCWVTEKQVPFKNHAGKVKMRRKRAFHAGRWCLQKSLPAGTKTRWSVLMVKPSFSSSSSSSSSSSWQTVLCLGEISLPIYHHFEGFSDFVSPGDWEERQYFFYCNIAASRISAALKLSGCYDHHHRRKPKKNDQDHIFWPTYY